MKYKYDEMTKVEQWIICSIDGDLINKILDSNNEELDIQFSINGVDVPFNLMVSRINESFDYNLRLELDKRSNIKTNLLKKIENIKCLSSKLYNELNGLIVDRDDDVL